MTIRRRIDNLEKRMGSDKIIKAFVIIRNHAKDFALRNAGCEAQKDMDLCPEYQKAKQYPKVNPNGAVIFRPPCGDCAGLEGMNKRAMSAHVTPSIGGG